MDIPPIGHLRNPSHSISVVIPVSNDASAIGRLLPQVAARLGASGYGWEIVVVDHGSSDHVSEVVGLFALSDGRPNVQLLQLSRDFGKDCALSAGLEAARGNAVICMDSDGAHPPELIDDMLRLWEDGLAVVIGAQERGLAGRNWLAQAWHRLHCYLQSDRQLHISPLAGDFRLLDRRVVNALLRLPERTRFLTGMVAWAGFKTAYLPFNPSSPGEVGIHGKPAPAKGRAEAGMASFSVRPLRMVARAGMAMATAALLCGAWIALDAVVMGNVVPGWATLAAGMLLLAGIQLVCLGVMAKYLGQVFEETRQRPLYVVADHMDYSRLRHPIGQREAGSAQGSDLPHHSTINFAAQTRIQ